MTSCEPVSFSRRTLLHGVSVWGMTWCRVVIHSRSFEVTYCLHFEGSRCPTRIRVYFHRLYSAVAGPSGSAVLRRGSAATRLLRLWVRIPREAWMSVCFECCVLSDRVICFGLISRLDEYYRMWCVWVWSWSLDNKEALLRLTKHKYALWVFIDSAAFKPCAKWGSFDTTRMTRVHKNTSDYEAGSVCTLPRDASVQRQYGRCG